MRTIQRDIVGGFIFSKDGKLLLGYNRKGGVYEGQLVVPGGGVEDGETQIEALKREMFEETGLDVSKGSIKLIFQSNGTSEKVLRDTKERVIVEMTFYNYRIDMPNIASEMHVICEDDWAGPSWYGLGELADKDMSVPTRDTLLKTGLITI